MATKDSNVFAKRNFGFSFIHWKIVNYCFEANNVDALISTPEFCVGGSYPTKWKMTLYPRMKYDGVCYFAVSLKRLHHCNGPDIVPVDLKMCLTDEENNLSCFVPFSAKVKNEGVHVIFLGTVKEIRGHLKPFSNEPGEIFIHCLFLINFEDCYKYCGIQIESELKSLSENFEKLYHSGADCDVVLRINGQDIHAHKDVLCRNRFFAYMIENETSNSVLDLSFFDYSAVKNVVRYLYSGNIDCIAKNASISIFDIISFFGFPHAKSYFKPEEIGLTSVIELKGDMFTWLIKDFSNVSTDCLMNQKSSCCNDMEWTFYLYPQGTNRKGRYVCVFADFVRGISSQCKDCCFAIQMWEYCGRVWAEEGGMINDKNGHLRLEKFISKPDIQSKLSESVSGNILMTFEFLIFTNNVHSSTMQNEFNMIGDYCSAINTHNLYKRYLCFSDDLKKSTGGKYSSLVEKAEMKSLVVRSFVSIVRGPYVISEVIRTLVQLHSQENCKGRVCQ